MTEGAIVPSDVTLNTNSVIYCRILFWFRVRLEPNAYAAWNRLPFILKDDASRLKS